MLDSVTYLLEMYWLYVAGAVLIGLVAGWFGYAPRKH